MSNGHLQRHDPVHVMDDLEDALAGADEDEEDEEEEDEEEEEEEEEGEDDNDVDFGAPPRKRGRPPLSGRPPAPGAPKPRRSYVRISFVKCRNHES